MRTSLSAEPGGSGEQKKSARRDQGGRGVYLSMLFLLPFLDLPILCSTSTSPTPVLFPLHSNLSLMALLSTVLGFSVFGLASRFGQLAIQKRNLMDSMLFRTHLDSSTYLTRLPFRLGWTCHCHGCIRVCGLLGTPLRSANKRAHRMETWGDTGQGRCRKGGKGCGGSLMWVEPVLGCWRSSMA